ncbi:ABC transporter substrate-binding protein [Sphingomonas sp. TX0543]|uniref:ABC transporter substrate-binding protein n=1 Tax=unclassified Sphingomonas TaxID=196159 RepID=UPI0010FA2C9B|nr:ABC transporter substrate-binding protein [Sphingomonas sp. 3P27F8]
MRGRSTLTLLGVAALIACKPPVEPAGPEALPMIHAQKVPGAIALLPRNLTLATPGTLSVAMVVGALPLADYARGEKGGVVGVEPNIAQLVADSLGLKLKITPVAWADWPLGLTSGKYDAVMSNVTVTEERKAKFDFSTYRDDQLGIYTRADGPIRAIKKSADIAGLKVAVGASTNQSQILDRWNAQNIAAGRKPAEPQYYDDAGIARLAVLSGRVDVSFGPNATAAYEARDGRTRRVGSVPGGWPLTAYIAVATRKGSGLAPAITAALNAQIDSGTYGRLLSRWNLASEGIKRSETNPPGLPKT